MYRVRNGKIDEHFANRDDIGMTQQLGLLPAAHLSQRFDATAALWHKAARGGNSTMRKSTGLGVVALSAIVMALFANLSSAEARGNCEAKLVGNSYDCAYVNNSGPGTECLEFVTGGTSIYFDGIYDGTVDFGCGCDSKGSLNSPSFDASSNTYECSLNGEPYLVIGTIKGKKLSNQGLDAEGDQYIETCTLRSTPCP